MSESFPREYLQECAKEFIQDYLSEFMPPESKSCEIKMFGVSYLLEETIEKLNIDPSQQFPGEYNIAVVEFEIPGADLKFSFPLLLVDKHLLVLKDKYGNADGSAEVYDKDFIGELVLVIPDGPVVETADGKEIELLDPWASTWVPVDDFMFTMIPHIMYRQVLEQHMQFKRHVEMEVTSKEIASKELSKLIGGFRTNPKKVKKRSD